ncbi:MAG: hypothetical protein IIC85_02520, partial [Chloroflexi bacterium]|nr:hypothetical protein [Chloroflexota bacterium]
MKRLFGSIPIIAVLVLLFGAVFNIVEQPQTAQAVSPIFRIYMVSPVPGAENSTDVDFNGDGIFTDEGALVETDWGKAGTTLKVRIQSGGMVAGDSNDTQVNVSVESDEANKSFGPILITERASGTAATDDGFIQFELILSASVTTADTGTAPYVGTGNEFSIQVDSDDEVTIVVEPSGIPTIDVARSITIGVENTDPSVQNVTPENGDVVDDEQVDITFS